MTAAHPTEGQAGRRDPTARRAEILSAAAAVFADRGYHRARMDDIVTQSGLSKGTLYWYFKSKDEIAIALVHQLLRDEEQSIDDVIAQSAPAAVRLEQLARGFARMLVQTPEHATLTLELLSLAQRIPEIKECFAKHHDRYLEQLAALVGEASDGRASAAQVEATARALGAVVDGLALRWALTPSHFDLEEQLWDTVAAVLQGVGVAT